MAEGRSDKSPFPGMDPYLESHWESIHARLMSYAADAIEPQLPDDLAARIEEGVLLDAAGEPTLRRKPHVYVVEEPTPQDLGSSGPPIAVADRPILLVIDADPIVHRHIEIIDSAGERVVTAIEFLSPWNKEGDGRKQYLEKREQFLSSCASLVEVDLVRGGNWLNTVAPYQVPREHRTTYRVTVKRAGVTGRMELYPISPRERLPTIAIPLRAGEPDIALNLQSLLDQVYRNGRYARTDYTKPADPPLQSPDADWVDQLLKSAGRR